MITLNACTFFLVLGGQNKGLMHARQVFYLPAALPGLQLLFSTTGLGGSRQLLLTYFLGDNGADTFSDAWMVLILPSLMKMLVVLPGIYQLKIRL